MVKSDPAGLVEYITRNLVKHPDDVSVITVKGPSSLVLELRVNKSDLGTVIGKGGRIAKSLRTILGSITSRSIVVEEGSVEKYQKIALEIIDDE